MASAPSPSQFTPLDLGDLLRMTQADLFSQIRALIPTLDGWCSVERAVDLAYLVIQDKPDWTVVLGTWGGRDTFSLALAHRFINHGKVLAVDPYRATASVLGQQGEDLKWWNDQAKHDLVYDRFMANTRALGLEPWIDFKRKTAAKAVPPKECGILVVDANHGPDSIADVEKWAPRIPYHGYCYADDINWAGGNVKKAVERLLALGFVELYRMDTGAFFQRVSDPAKRRAKG